MTITIDPALYTIRELEARGLNASEVLGRDVDAPEPITCDCPWCACGGATFPTLRAYEAHEAS